MSAGEKFKVFDREAAKANAVATLAHARISALAIALHLEEGRQSLGDGRMQVSYRRRRAAWVRRLVDWWAGRKTDSTKEGV